MHLLATKPGEIAGEDAAVDLGQDPAEIVVLSAADSEIACLAAAYARQGEGAPSLRLANLMRLRHNLSVDLYADDVVAKARLVVVRLLGGESYWPYGVRRIVEVAAGHGVAVAFLPGDDKPDPGLASASTVPPAQADLLWRYLIQGGERNAALFLQACAHLLGRAALPEPPILLPHAGVYWPRGETGLLRSARNDDLFNDRHCEERSDAAIQESAGAPIVPIVFYRALVQAANLAPIDDLIAALKDVGLNPLPIYVQSLRDRASIDLLDELIAKTKPAVILNATAFAVATPGKAAGTVLDRADCPVMQMAFAGSSEEAWREGLRGLDARDLAMNVALPEIDGRLISRAVSFKAPPSREPQTQADLTPYRPVPDRIRFVVAQAKAWCDLRTTPAPGRRVGFIMANYPNKDGRLGNGVGLDTPNGLLTALRAMGGAGYDIGTLPEGGDALMRCLNQGPTNADPSRAASEHLALADYIRHFDALPEALRQAVIERWGPPGQDRFLDRVQGFRLPLVQFGSVVIGLQPSRGYDIDPAASYHDPDLVPPHGYLAFYFWLRYGFGAHALVHMGKHGTMEWLPGKAVALSETCWPEAVFGPTPHLYPFIVNDPGEGSQAKRRATAVIIDHLTPPLTRAESYGPLAKLEALVDEYFAASGLDPRRRQHIGRDILDLALSTGLDRDCGLDKGMDTEAALTKLDAHLCDLKEMQIRDGLHVFGQSPTGEQRIDLLLALARAPRGTEPHQASLIRALADDLGLGFDPLAASFADAWVGPRPDLLTGDVPWRTAGDTVERLEALAKRLVAGEAASGLPKTQAVLDWITAELAPALDGCGAAEIEGLLKGLDGRFVPPGPSGAPSRGRPEVLPTGRNFYSLDTRMVPTSAAWTLGWRSACGVIERYVQDHGDYPKSVALSAWGTANMRTGGDDIAQALALMGVRPVWETVTGRVTGFEIIPAQVLDRPRVDVTLRVSGFFRDAFPNLLALVDSAARAVAALDEPEQVNPMAAKARAEIERLTASGVDAETAKRRAGARVFGSKPGSYGAGLQAYIDEGGWSARGELAEAYVAWSGWAYGTGEGEAAHEAFRTLLARTEAVLHNQDNREHDLLDSDDYYQFEGGLASAVRMASGHEPTIYHNDHSRPETPKIRTLAEEIGRVVHARAANPKWLNGVMRHGYKGAFEIAATVDYLFAFAATTEAVSDKHFDALYGAYVLDETVDAFLVEHNPEARVEIARRFDEAIRRDLWHPRQNSVRDVLTQRMERAKR